MTKKQRNIAKNALCEWLAQTGEMSLFSEVSGKEIEKHTEYVFAVTVEEREFAVLRFIRGIYANSAPLLGIAGGFIGDDDEACTAFSNLQEFPKDHKAAEKLARKLAEHILKG